jgi:hypothetical protein
MNFDNLPWDQIREISEKGIFEEVFKKIPKSRFEFAAKEENLSALANSALKSLKRKDSNAFYEQALVLANIMQEFARKIINTK